MQFSQKSSENIYHQKLLPKNMIVAFIATIRRFIVALKITVFFYEIIYLTPFFVASSYLCVNVVLREKNSY